jgi:hypothetical protein
MLRAWENSNRVVYEVGPAENEAAPPRWIRVLGRLALGIVFVYRVTSIKQVSKHRLQIRSMDAPHSGDAALPSKLFSCPFKGCTYYEVLCFLCLLLSRGWEIPSSELWDPIFIFIFVFIFVLIHLTRYLVLERNPRMSNVEPHNRTSTLYLLL